MAATTRLYVIEGEGKTTLVEAASQAQALGHVARSRFTVKVAAAKDVAALLTAGAAVEKAAAEPAK